MKVLIIGGGASGMMAALSARKEGAGFVFWNDRCALGASFSQQATAAVISPTQS